MRDFLKIGEFSALGRVSVRMLRHYEALGLLLPAETDASTGYRYYRLDQLPRLNRIIALNELGFPLKQIANFLASVPSAAEMRALLEHRRAKLAAEIRQNRQRLLQVDVRLTQIGREGLPLEQWPVVVKPLPAATVASFRGMVPSLDVMAQYCDQHFGILHDWLEERGLPTDGLTMNLYHLSDYREIDLDMESVVVLDASIVPRTVAEGQGSEVKIRQLASAPQSASLVLESGFADMESGAMTLLSWIAASGLELAGPLREVHLFGSPGGDSEGSEVLEIAAPTRKRTS